MDDLLREVAAVAYQVAGAAYAPARVLDYFAQIADQTTGPKLANPLPVSPDEFSPVAPQPAPSSPSPQRAENGRIPHEGSGIYAPGENCHCKIYGHDSACALGKRCLCAYCVSFAQPTPESTGLEEQAREWLTPNEWLAKTYKSTLEWAATVTWTADLVWSYGDYRAESKLAHISLEKDARITQLEKGAEGLEKYVQHLDGCMKWGLNDKSQRAVLYANYSCTCGRDAALLVYQKIKGTK